MKANIDPEQDWRLATKLVRGGTKRSPFDETSEGLFMTSGYVYGSAEEAERAFKGEDQRFVYSRYANPTVEMFESRLAMLEGAALCRGTSSGMAAVFAVLNGLRLVDISNNLGDAKSLATHPATTTHQRFTPEERAEMGIGDGLVRLSVGLEDAEDICDDLDRALAAVS